MIRKSYFSAIVAVLALVACSKDFQELAPQHVDPISSDNVHTLSVGIEAGTYTPVEGETKASMEAVIRVNWTENDEVSVVNASTGKILGGCLKATDSGVSVTFEGTVTGTINQNDKLYYIYPRLIQNENEDDFGQTGYDVSLAGQTYDGENPGKVSFFGYAEDVAGSNAISKKIQFTLVTSYAHLNMANLPAKGFNLSSIDISNVNKGFTWSLSDLGELTADAYGENEGISVNCSNCKITQAGNAVVRFAIPASAATGARVVTVNKAYTNDKYVKSELKSSAYYNQLYTSWTNENVSVKTAGDKTEVTIDNLGSTETAEGILPVSGESSSAFDNSKPTEISLGGLGTITFNQQASAAIKNNTQNAQSTNVFFKVEDVTQTKPVQNANLVYEITMKTVDGNGTEVFSEDNAGTGSEATVVIELGQSVSSVESVSLVDDNGQPVSGDAVKDVNFDPQTGKLTFTVFHFSKYAIKYTTKAEPESGYVAQIGGRKYETLASAIDAAQNGNTIQMIANHVAPAKIEIGADKNIVLDLNGYTISYSTSEFEAFITNKGSLKITDSSNGKNGKITATHSKLDYSHGCYTIDNFGGDQSADKVSKLVIDGGTIENASTDAGLAWPVNNGSWNSNAELIINGGTIHSVNYVPVREYLHCGGKKTIVINGGKFISDNSRAIAVQVNDATIKDTGSSVTINGGEFTCNGSGILYIDLHAANVDMTDFAMTVNGGKFSNNNTEKPVLAYDDEGNSQTSAVLLSKILKGGTYSKEPASELLADGYELVDNQDAGYPYKVQQKPFVAMIGGVEYATLADAIAAVKDGETITMLGNVDKAAGISVPEGKNFTVDFSGFTYAMECPGAGSAATKTAGFQLLKNSTIVFKNGTLKCTDANKDKTWSSGDASKGIAIMIQNYSNLTLEDITIDATNIAHNGAAVRYALSNNCGTVEYKGTTTITTAGNDYAFDVCKYMDYSAPTVTWNSTGTVNGGIELSGGKFVVAKNLSVSVPVMAAEGESTLEIGTAATLSSASDFDDPNPNLTNHKSTAPVQVKQGAGLTICGDGTVEGINNAYSAVIVSINGDNDTKAAKLTVNGSVTLEGNYFGIAGNGNRHNTEIIVNSGTIKGTYAGDNLGIYHPQGGKLTINGESTKIIGYNSGIEMRAGTLVVNNGTIEGTATETTVVPNGSGSTTVGAGIAIAKHTTNLPISVTINGGTIKGAQAISNANPQNVDAEVTVTINGGTFSDLSGVNYVADNGTYKLANDVSLTNPLEINSGKTFTIDLNSKTLTGRTNIKHGNVTFKNGNINGGSLQALNVYGSSESSVTNYSVVTVDSDVTVTAEVFGVCLFGPVYNSNVGYGAGIDVKGTITTTKNSSSNEGAVFVSGNLGGGKNDETQTSMEGKNFVNISGTVTSASDAALALQGSATATITGTLTGNTGIAAKRGKLIVKENAVITGNGACVGNPASNGNGTELTGSAVSASSTYGQKLTIDLQGGTYTSAAYTILNNAVDDACTFNISGGRYESTKSGDGIAVYARLGSVNITGGEFINNSNSEATLHVGCPEAVTKELQPKLTIFMKQAGGGMMNGMADEFGGGGTIGGTNFIVRNNATGQYKHNSSMKPLTVNMANELTYKAVTISNTGEFYGQNPTKDDSYTGDDQQNCKWFLGNNIGVQEVSDHYQTYIIVQ